MSRGVLLPNSSSTGGVRLLNGIAQCIFSLDQLLKSTQEYSLWIWFCVVKHVTKRTHDPWPSEKDKSVATTYLFKGVQSLLSNSNTLSITVVPGMKSSRKWSCTAAIGLLQDGNAQLITKTKRKIICQPYMGHTHSALAPDAHRSVYFSAIRSATEFQNE